MEGMQFYSDFQPSINDIDFSQNPLGESLEDDASGFTFGSGSENGSQRSTPASSAFNSPSLNPLCPDSPLSPMGNRDGRERSSLDSPLSTRRIVDRTFQSPPRRGAAGSFLTPPPHPRRAILGDQSPTLAIGMRDLTVNSPQQRRGDGFLTPPRGTPTKRKRGDEAVTKETPPQVRTYEKGIRQFKLELSLFPNDVGKAEQGMEALSDVPEPKKGELCARLAREILSLGSGYQEVDESDWAPDHLTKIRATSTNIHGVDPLENIDHIFDPDQGKGWHVCRRDDPRYALLMNIQENVDTGIFIAQFPGKGGKLKTSTFFPDSIEDREKVLLIIKNANTICRFKNRSLCLGTHDGKLFYLIKYFKAGGFLLNSAFPIFFVGDLDTQESFSILPGIEFSKAQIVSQITTLIKSGSYEQQRLFRHEGRSFWDLSSVLNIKSIDRGICFWLNDIWIDEGENNAADTFHLDNFIRRPGGFKNQRLTPPLTDEGKNN